MTFLKSLVFFVDISVTKAYFWKISGGEMYIGTKQKLSIKCFVNYFFIPNLFSKVKYHSSGQQYDEGELGMDGLSSTY